MDTWLLHCPAGSARRTAPPLPQPWRRSPPRSVESGITNPGSRLMGGDCDWEHAMVYEDGDADWEHAMAYEDGDGDWMLLRCRGSKHSC